MYLFSTHINLKKKLTLTYKGTILLMKKYRIFKQIYDRLKINWIIQTIFVFI